MGTGKISDRPTDRSCDSESSGVTTPTTICSLQQTAVPEYALQSKNKHFFHSFCCRGLYPESTFHSHNIIYHHTHTHTTSKNHQPWENLTTTAPRKLPPRRSHQDLHPRVTLRPSCSSICLRWLSSIRQKLRNKESALLKVTGYAGADSKGYRNPLKELIKEKQWLFKESSGDKNKEKLIGLTEAGRDHCISVGMLVVPKEPETQDEFITQIKTLLDKDVKGPTRKNVDKIWTVLEDGQYHTIQELLDATGYAGADSKGYRNVMKGLLNQGLVEKDQMSMFSCPSRYFPPLWNGVKLP